MLEERADTYKEVVQGETWATLLAKNKTEFETALNLVILGPSGAGKSTTTNALLEPLEDVEPREVAKVGGGQESCTKTCTVYQGRLCGRRANLIDTPGFNDSHGLADEDIMA